MTFSHHKHFISIYAAVLLLGHLCYSVVVEGDLEGPNVCMKIKPHKKMVQHIAYESVPKKIEYTCYFLFTCYGDSNELQKVVNNVFDENETYIKVCCEGYRRSPKESRCIPVCHPECKNGVCWSPNICKCDDYFTGQDCDIHYVCEPGFSGPACDIPCEDGFYGENCENTCDCYWNQTVTCDPKEGKCKCLPDYTGEECEQMFTEAEKYTSANIENRIVCSLTEKFAIVLLFVSITLILYNSKTLIGRLKWVYNSNYPQNEENTHFNNAVYYIHRDNQCHIDKNHTLDDKSIDLEKFSYQPTDINDLNSYNVSSSTKTSTFANSDYTLNTPVTPDSLKYLNSVDFIKNV